MYRSVREIRRAWQYCKLPGPDPRRRLAPGPVEQKFVQPADRAHRKLYATRDSAGPLPDIPETRKPSDRDASCRVLPLTGNCHRDQAGASCLLSGLFALMAVGGAPSRLRTCAHGSGGGWRSTRQAAKTSVDLPVRTTYGPRCGRLRREWSRFTSAGSSDPCALTCDAFSGHALTCEVASRQFSLLPAGSRCHVPRMCPSDL